MTANQQIPIWCSNGGSLRLSSIPGKWFKKTTGNHVGQWNRKELIPYGKANPEYREKYYQCPECGSSLAPMERKYRFACQGCRLIFASGFGALYGFGSDNKRAEYVE